MRGWGRRRPGGNSPGGNILNRPIDGAVDRGGVGFAGGIQGGFNWQFAPQLVAGVEGDLGYLSANRSFKAWDESVVFGVKTNGYGTVRGRLGYTPGPSLFYATGGAAFVNVKNNFDRVAPDVLASNSKIASGWTLGGGIETLLGGNWSAKAEYLYIDAGTQDVVNSFIGDTAHFRNRFDVYKYGLNYKFGGPAIAGSVLPSHNWTGFYAGVNMGAALSQVEATTSFFLPPTGTSVGLADSGFTGGAQAGYNWQFSPNLVAGIEGDIGYLGIKRSSENWDNPGFFFGVKTDWYGTVRGRFGYSTGPALLYATGGAAFVHVKDDLFDSLDDHVKSATKSGWTVGGGIESALAQNWTAKTEYLYIDAGKQTVLDPTFIIHHFNNRFHVFRFGLNYAFGGPSLITQRQDAGLIAVFPLPWHEFTE